MLGSGIRVYLSFIETTQGQIESAFRTFTSREDIAILLINQYIANEIRGALDEYLDNLDRRPSALPTILEIPSKTHPYEIEKDSLMQRVQGMLGPRDG